MATASHTRAAGAARRRPGPAGLLTAVGLPLLLVWLGVTLLDPATLPIRQIRIEGDFINLSPPDLQRRVSDRLRGGFLNLDVDAVRRALLAEPWVSRVAVKRVWPDRLRVTVTEQVPAARWGGDGLLNTAGEYFASGAGGIPPGLPRLHGPPGSEALLFARFKDAKARLRAAGLGVAALKLDARRAWSLRLDNGARVILGRRDFVARLDRFLRFAPAALTGQNGRAAVIDMRYTNGFAAQWAE